MKMYGEEKGGTGRGRRKGEEVERGGRGRRKRLRKTGRHLMETIKSKGRGKMEGAEICTFEGLVSTRGSVLVGMELEGKLPVLFL